jgi:hypothetical protein
MENTVMFQNVCVTCNQNLIVETYSKRYTNRLCVKCQHTKAIIMYSPVKMWRLIIFIINIRL